jgi:phosphatidylethanolamine-binding protein
MGTTLEAPDIFVKVSPAITALVVVDMQNYFLHPSCTHNPVGLAAADNILAVVEKCLEVRIQVCSRT